MRLPGLLLLTALAVRPVAADMMLYAVDALQSPSTDPQPARIDAYCLRADGSLPPTPSSSIMLQSGAPRRMILAKKAAPDNPNGPLNNDALYVAEQGLVEGFAVGADGKLTRLGNTKPDPGLNLRGLEVARSTDGTLMLYVSEAGRDRVAGYVLDATGKPSEDPVTCIQDLAVRQIRVSRNQIFVGNGGSNGRIDVFDINAEGLLLDGTTPTTKCPNSDPIESKNDATPVKRRKKIQNPRDFIIVGDLLYVEEVDQSRIAALRISAFPPPPPTTSTTLIGTTSSTTTSNTVAVTTTTSTSITTSTQQKPVSKTDTVTSYERLILSESSDSASGSTILASQFFDSHVDAYLLHAPNAAKPKRCATDACDLSSAECCLPKRATGKTNKDVRMSPVGITVVQVGERRILYVGAGAADTVRAYILDKKGVPAATQFSETDPQKGSFPNDVAVAVLSGTCQ